MVRREVGAVVGCGTAAGRGRHNPEGLTAKRRTGIEGMMRWCAMVRDVSRSGPAIGADGRDHVVGHFHGEAGGFDAVGAVDGGRSAEGVALLAGDDLAG